MCVITHDVIKYICAHRIEKPNPDYCDDYISLGECNNVTNNYPASNTKRIACPDCQAKKTIEQDVKEEKKSG